MSGITPILDTLLHQVLGKRVEVPPSRDLNQPVRPLDPGQALTALHSDSRLDPRAQQRPAPSIPSTLSTPSQHTDQAGQRTARPPVAPSDTPPGSTRTHFSVAARTIADLLVRFPAPPSTLRATAPLMAAGEGNGNSAARLAPTLQASINQSGLFYESHLRHWFSGTLGRESLAREPQMSLANASAPGAAAPSATAPGSSAAPAPAATPGAPAPNTEAGPDSTDSRRGDGAQARPVEPLNEPLQGLLRHQLEMLVTPVLRWEGDVWSGLFMALMIALPQDTPRQGEGGTAGDQGQDNEEGATEEGAAEDWTSELGLSLPTLGRVRVRLRLAQASVALSISAGTEEAARRLEQNMDGLRARLEAMDFQQVDLRVAVEQSDDGQH